MASEREAKCALETHERQLRALGAHSVTVDRVGRGNRKTYAIIARFDAPPHGVPKTVDVIVSKKVVAVPVVVTRR
jgi:hypothetical protein